MYFARNSSDLKLQYLPTISSSNNIIRKPFEANNNGNNKVLELIMEMHLYRNGKCNGFAISMHKHNTL